jgi:hypothetical protein
MKFSGIKKFGAVIACIIAVLSLLHCITYSIDKTLIGKDSDPWLCKKTVSLKDGGTKVYYGLGYQIIKWNKISTKIVSGEYIHGVEHGFEIHRYPYFVDWAKGPTVALKFIQQKSNE